MVDLNIQMKKFTNGIWNNLFPYTTTKNVFESYSKKTLDTLLKELKAQDDLIRNKSNTINVRDFGAKGDGVTDDTIAIQKALDSVTTQRQTILFPSTNGNHYSVTSLTLKNGVTTYEGEGDARIYFTDRVGIHIEEEFQVFKNLTIWHKGADHTGVRIFNDERTNTRLDFDLLAKGCNFAYADKVVSTWGRGVILHDCDFNDITGHFIYLSVKLESEISVGGYDIMKYKTGYRGYKITGSRFHYCNTAWAMESVNDFSNVVQGVTMLGNQIEGGIGYYKGFVRAFLFKDNNHYQADTQKDALFEFTGFQDVDIDIKITGMQNNLDGYSKRIKRLITSTAGGENLKVRGSLRGVKKHVITLYQGSSNIDIDLSVSDVVGDEYAPSLLYMVGATTYDTIIVRGSFYSNDNGTIGVNSNQLHTIYNFNADGLIMRGKYSSKSNIAPT